MTLTQMSRRFSQLFELSLGCSPSCRFSVITVIDRLVIPFATASSHRRCNRFPRHGADPWASLGEAGRGWLAPAGGYPRRLARRSPAIWRSRGRFGGMPNEGGGNRGRLEEGVTFGLLSLILAFFPFSRRNFFFLGLRTGSV